MNHDRLVSEHILKRKVDESYDNSGLLKRSRSDCSSDSNSQEVSGRFSSSLSQRLKFNTQSRRLLEAHELRRYIQYAREHVHPKLTGKAAKILQKLYLTLRAQVTERCACIF